MISALLDHPWPLEVAVEANSDGFDVLLRFVELTRLHGIRPVRFITQADLADVWERIGTRHADTSGAAALRRFARLFVRDTAFHCSATPSPEPPGLTTNWKCALRDATDVDDWRNPQIIIPESRRASWGLGDEVGIRFEVCDDFPSSGPYERVLAALDTYETHRFALSDSDPWDLRRVHPPPEDAPAHRRHPCFLPKPPCVEGVALENLAAALHEARATGWEIGGRRYFIPPANWRPDNKSKQTWREGRAFDRRRVRERDDPGYLDYRNIVWIWDDAHRHWDVQTKPDYLRLRCTGEEY